MNILAHAENLHTEETSDTVHYLTEPFLAIPLLILVAIGLYALLKKVGWPLPRILLLIFGLMLVLGITMYSISPAVSIFSLTIGIAGTLFMTLTNLSQG